jgi:hypothetical protein
MNKEHGSSKSEIASRGHVRISTPSEEIPQTTNTGQAPPRDGWIPRITDYLTLKGFKDAENKLYDRDPPQWDF